MKGYQSQTVERCENCVHFEKHYTRDCGKRYVSTIFGHCAYPRIKIRRIDEHCQHFTPVREDQMDESGED